MRKSVERRLREQERPVARPSWFVRHRAILLFLVVAPLATGALIWWADTNEKHLTANRNSAQQQEFARIDQQIKTTLQKRVDDARNAEAAARAGADTNAASTAASAAAYPSGAQSSVESCTVTTPDSITVILNKKHCFNPVEWAPDDLEQIDGFYLRKETAVHMQSLMQAAVADNAPIELSSAYRSYTAQQSTYATWVAVNGNQAAADTISARPGFNEHQTGLAADLKIGNCYLECFGSTAQYAWLVEHAADYGFIRRYPVGLTSITGYSPESWHWRYVGTKTAQDMKRKGIETLEAYFNISGGDY